MISLCLRKICLPLTSLYVLTGSLLVAGSETEQVKRFTLENGLTVLVKVQSELPLVNVAMLYRVGSANEVPGITGVAHFVEHMNFRATAEVSKADITGFIDRVGGRWNGYTSIDQTLYTATVPSWGMEELLHIESQRMSQALFDPDEFQRERFSVISELQGYENDPLTKLWDLALATSFQVHPYRYNIIGWLSDVLSLKRNDAFRFYRNHYGPNNAVLAVVGDVEPERVRLLVKKYFGNLKPVPQTTTVTALEPPQKGQKRVELVAPSAGQKLLIVFRAPPADHADFPVLLVLDAVLAGGRDLLSLPGPKPAGSASRLQEVVAKAGGNEAFSALTPSRYPYVYAIGAGAPSSADSKGLETVLMETLKALEERGVTDEELTLARQRLGAIDAFGQTRLADQAHLLAYYEALGSWKLADSIREGIERVSRDDIRRYAADWLRPHQSTVALQRSGRLPEEEGGGRLETKPPPPAADVRPSPVPSRALRPVSRAAIETSSKTSANGVHFAAAAHGNGSSATLHLRLGFGSRLDPEGREGLAMLAARALTGDRLLKAELFSQGVILTNQAEERPRFSNHEYFDLTVRFPAGRLMTVLEKTKEILKPKEFTGDQIEEFRRRMLAELEALEEDSAWIAQRAALKGCCPQLRSPLGSAGSLSSITPDEVNNFLAAHLKAGSLWVSLAGPFQLPEMESVLSEAVGFVPAGGGPTWNAFDSDPEKVQPLLPIPGKTQAEVAAALPGVARGHADILSLRLLNYILGETGYAGRLGSALVDSGLAYSVYATPHFGKLPGPWLFQTGTAETNLEQTLRSIRAVVTRLNRDGIEEWELQEAQAYLLGRMVLNLESDEMLALTLVESQYFGEDLLDFPARSARILSVTVDQVNQAASRYLRPEALSIAAAGAVGR